MTQTQTHTAEAGDVTTTAKEGHFPNYAGRSDRDDEIAAELEAAGIEVHRFESMRNQGEVKTSVMGSLTGWSFRRAWYYWVAEGNGIELAAAERLHAKHPKTVRVEGHCGCPSPREWCKGLAVGSYHVDSPEGLKGLADTIRELTGPATASPAPGALADLPARVEQVWHDYAPGGGWSITDEELGRFVTDMTRTILESPPAASAPPVDGGAQDDETEDLFQSERISAAQATYDEAMADYDPTATEHEVHAFDAMKAAIGRADALEDARRHPKPAAGAAGLVEALKAFEQIGVVGGGVFSVEGHERCQDLAVAAFDALARHATPDGEKTEKAEAFPYQRTFDAIAAATKQGASGIEISVAKFREAFAATPQGAGETAGGVDLENHHNAERCPYCNPNGWTLQPTAAPEQAGSRGPELQALDALVAAEAKRVSTIEAYNAELMRQRERGVFPVRVQPEYEAMENARHEFWDAQKHMLKVAAAARSHSDAEGQA